ncbi:hypothetical protein GpartN1_g5629.t1 [Galdieria partita]|uniref:separase n=1 Tax=Galdieria partita TaxID=83374 RepID=A0A9C7USH4_9RHOD|nr:hypothetical protein GpartN1_g5629.t1 [Galdieria partita]
MNDKQLFQELLQGTDLKKALQELDHFIKDCEELYNPYHVSNHYYSEDTGAKQLRLLTEKGRGFATVAKNKLENILKFIRQFDILCRKDWKQEFCLTNEEYEKIGCTFFSLWKRCLDMLFLNKSLLKFDKESDLEKYSYNFIANTLNRGFWVDALKECFRYLFHLSRRLGGLKNVTYQSLFQENSIQSIFTIIQTNWKLHYSMEKLNNDFFLILFSLMRALRMSLENEQVVLKFDECSLNVITILSIIVNIWREVCIMDESKELMSHIATILKALRQETFLILHQILWLYEKENTEWTLKSLMQSAIELYWQSLECQLCISDDDAIVVDIKEDKMWSSQWLQLVTDIVFNLHKNSLSIRELLHQIFRKMKKKGNFYKLHSRCLLNCKLIMDMSRWFPQQELKRTVNDWLEVSKTLIELFDAFEAFSIFKEIEQKRYSWMLLLQQKNFQNFSSCFKDDSTSTNDLWTFDFVLHRWMLSYVNFHFQNSTFIGQVLQSFSNMLKRSSYHQTMTNDIVKAESWHIFDVVKSAIMTCLHDEILDEEQLYDLLFPTLEAFEAFISATFTSSDDLLKNVAKMFHNIAALLVQRKSALLIASICMRRSIEFREKIKNEKADQINRLGLLCKIMLRLSDPCAYASIVLEMIDCASFLYSPSKVQIPSDILKALSFFACWCENNEVNLQEYFGIGVFEQLAIQSGPNAVEFAFIAFRILRWEMNYNFTQMHNTFSCEKNCAIVLQNHCNDPIKQYWLEIEILRLTVYTDSTLDDAHISVPKDMDKDKNTTAQVDCLQMIHLGWKLLVDLMHNSHHSFNLFKNSGILGLWNRILQHSSQSIPSNMLIHLLEILEWLCDIFIVTQNSHLLWTTVQMLCQFIMIFGKSCPIDMIRMREYLTFVSAIALKNYRLYENARVLLSHSCANELKCNGNSMELYLLQFALDISSYQRSNVSEIPNLRDNLCHSKSSQALYKFYLSQYLWKKGDLKGSYDEALESVKLYLGLLQHSSCQSTSCVTLEDTKELKTLNLAGTQINMRSTASNVGFMNDLRQAAECLCWLGDICNKIGCISEAEYYWQCCLDVFQWIQCFPCFFETTFHLMMLYRKSLQNDKFKRSIESFQMLIEEVQQAHQDSILQASTGFCLKRLGLLNEIIYLDRSTTCCLNQLEECSENCFSNDNCKFHPMIERRFMHPHDEAICFYNYAKKKIYELSQSHGRAFGWKCTSRFQQSDQTFDERVSYIIHLIEQALQTLACDPLPWLQKRLFLLMAKCLDHSQGSECLYFVQKACGLEYWYQYQVYQSNQEAANDCDIVELNKALQLKWQISTPTASSSCDKTKHSLSYSYAPLLESLPKEWTIVGLTPDVSGEEMYLWLRPGSHQMKETPVLTKYPFKSLEHSRNTLEVLRSRLERLIQASRDQASGRISENPTMEEKSLWWKERKELDEQFSEYMQELEDALFGAWKIFFLSIHHNTMVDQSTMDAALDQLQEMIGNESILDRQLFQILFSRRIFLDRKEDWLYLLTYAIDYYHRSPSQQSKLFKKLEEYVNKWWIAKDSGRTRSKSLGTKLYEKLKPESTILLVLDDTLLPLPIESIPFLRKWKQGITRISNLELASCLFSRQKKSLQYDQSEFCYTVSSQDAFFILNPTGDLNKTQQSFENLFQQTYHWEGIMGPLQNSSRYQAKELVEKLSRHQLFIYCGHGTGEKFFPAKQIRKLEQAPVTLLMGCSSGKPSNQGIYSPTVPCFSFLYAHAQAVVVNLWDVTDRDIDRFTQCLLEEWFTSNASTDLSLALVRAREKCYFRHLTGCAPVVYGLPWIRATQ